MPTGVRKSRKKGKKYAIYDKRTGKVKGHSTSKRKAHIAASKRDQGHRKKRRK